jgi:cysteine desulfurase
MTSSAYLDNSATTKPTEGVMRAMARCMSEGYYNPSSLYAPAVAAERAINACREAIARALCVQPERVFFTSGGTEANNLAILGAVSSARESSHIIALSTEHPSVLNAAGALKAMGHRVTLIHADRAGQPDWAQLEEALRDPPALAACAHVTN